MLFCITLSSHADSSACEVMLGAGGFCTTL